MADNKRLDPAALDALDLKRLFHPNTNLAAHHVHGPVVFERGEGIHVWDSRGKPYIEAMAGLWCTTLGYGNAELADAAHEQIRKLSFTQLFAGKSNEPAIRLAAKLAELAPTGQSRAFFGTSGSDANDTQVKLAWYYNNAIGRPRKKKIISRQRAYHGTTLVAAALSGLPAFHRGFDLPLPPILHAAAPYAYRDAASGESDEDYATRLAEDLERLIVAEDPDTVAAFIAEPVMAVGGVLVPPVSYFEKVQAVLDRYDVLMIDDEVICGFGRTGRMWGAETVGMRPDTISVAKGLTSAYVPVSAVLVPEHMYEAIAAESGRGGMFGHGFTYSGHPVGAAVALKTLEIYERDGLYRRAAELSPQFQHRLRALGGHPLVGDARGVGLVGGCELVRDKATKEPFDAALAIGTKCMDFCQQHGVIVRALGDSFALCPPYIVTPADIDEIFDRIEAGLDATLDWVRRQGLV